MITFLDTDTFPSFGCIKFERTQESKK
jgi:hypothetical protein